MDNFSEDSLVEQPAIALFAELGWETADCYEETFGPQGTLVRETSNEVILLSHLLPALERLNPDLSPEVFQLAIDELLRDRGLMSPAPTWSALSTASPYCWLNSRLPR